MQEQSQAQAKPEDVEPQGTTVRIGQDGQQVGLDYLACASWLVASTSAANKLLVLPCLLYARLLL